MTDLDDIIRSWTYGYDLQDRLNSAIRPSRTIGYTYDANGNRLTETGTSAAAYAVSASSNRLNSVGGSLTRTYAYDAAGNTTGYGGLTFAYEDSGRLKSVTNGAVTTTYTLNALGQRVRKSNASSTRLFVYDEAGRLLGEYDGSGDLIQEIVWLNDLPVAALCPSGSGVSVLYVHSDHLGTPRRLSRPADNVVVWRWDSDPFGTAAADEDPDGDSVVTVFNLRFPGQYLDGESGLHYNYFRDYDSATGRYIESDPIGLEGGINTYAYAGSNPVMRVDPLGLFLCGDWKWMAVDWALGLGSRNRTYGASSEQVSQVRNLPPVQDAKDLYRRKNQKELGSPCCNQANLQSYTSHKGTFGLSGYAKATLMGSCAWNFIGSMAVNVYPVSCTTVRIVVTNNSSFTSFAYGIGPSWTRGPGSNMHQTYEWEESL